MASGKKREELEEETENSGLTGVICIHAQNGLPDLSYLPRKLAHNKKSNLERHFTKAKKHTQLGKYPTGDVMKKLLKSSKTTVKFHAITWCNLSNNKFGKLWVSLEIVKEETIHRW
ncbi:hypothetical protein AVEN_228553-1 [Araneus ventricosus]|uniref:Uncharacterized protein n=1 Tax=Araneus ventricosus TaxID=182803 RepID=A0A4Y2THL5_ARAVE|nr:hypothetical protein AVEN_228553-1 [Araneus ventricosus]